jgi:hypothetical protein
MLVFVWEYKNGFSMVLYSTFLDSFLFIFLPSIASAWRNYLVWHKPIACAKKRSRPQSQN